MTGKLNNARNTIVLLQKEKNQPNPQKMHKQCLMGIQSETMQNKGPLTVSDDQLSLAGNGKV